MQRLRHPSTGLAALLAFGLGAAIVAVVLIAAAVTKSITWGQPEYGNLPAWLTLVASGGTLVGVVAAWRTLQTNLAHRQDDEASIARTLVIEGVSTTYRTTKLGRFACIVVTLRNANTTSAFTGVRVTGVAYADIGCQQTMRDTILRLREGAHRFVPPNTTLQSAWATPVPVDGDTFLNTTLPSVRYQYTDGNGRKWERIDHMEPRRLRGRDFDAERAREFQRVMDAKPGGDSNNQLPIDVDLAIRSAFPPKPDEGESPAT